jgi:Icc-related predicted phosphoesterase
MDPVRLAATGDVHCVDPLRDHLVSAFADLAEHADLLVIAGDLTTHGLPEQARVLTDACGSLQIPCFVVLGNHDYHSGCADQVREVLEAGGVIVLDGDHAVCQINGLEIGVVGTKGFVGGFAGAELPDFGEQLLRDVYRETTREVEALERSLEAVAGCQRVVVILHYAPIADTLVGEPEAIWAFLGSSRLAAPIGAHRPHIVVHGHAHHGAPRGQIGSVPVHNVSVQVTGQPYVLFEL